MTSGLVPIVAISYEPISPKIIPLHYPLRLFIFDMSSQYHPLAKAVNPLFLESTRILRIVPAGKNAEYLYELYIPYEDRKLLPP